MESATKSLHSSCTGRFAPSPTGDLHFGSLISALASFLQARRMAGKWLVRIEDLDPPREVPGSSDSILRELDRLGLMSDEPVLYQSERTVVYREVVDSLLEQGKAFWCGCTRKDLPPNGIYPGTCRNGIPSGKSRRAVRLRVSDETISCHDLIQGPMRENLENSVGDFIILRADGLPAYQLAVVIDDAFQGVTQVVRGMDLFTSTARQIFLHQQLGTCVPEYAHHPLAVQRNGNKLGKRFGSVPVSQMDRSLALFHALQFLGQSPPVGADAVDLLDWALTNWDLSRLPSGRNLVAPPFAQPD